MSIIVSGNVPLLLRPGLDQVGIDYAMPKGLYSRIYDVRKSTLNFEQDVDMKGTGLMEEKFEGDYIAMDSMSQSYVYQFVHRVFALGFEISDVAAEDDQYASKFFRGTKELTDSYVQTREVMAMNMFNQAFSTKALIADGQPLCSAAHPYEGGTYSNFVGDDNIAVDFSETGVERAVILAKRMKNQAGLFVSTSIDSLLVPSELLFAGCRLLQSVFRPGTGNNDINAMKELNSIPGGCIDTPFLYNPKAWFALTNLKDTRRHFERRALSINVNTDPSTLTTAVRASGRFSFGPFTPRGVIGGGATIA